MDRKELINKVLGIAKIVYNYIGGICMFVAGLFFVLIADVKKINLSSYWMFVMIVLAAAGGLLFLIAEYQKDKPIKFYILKGLGILFSAGFLAALMVFNTRFVQIPKPNKYSTVIFLVSLVINAIGLSGQIGNVVINIVKGIEE